jgi:hypothetical protein
LRRAGLPAQALAEKIAIGRTSPDITVGEWTPL